LRVFTPKTTLCIGKVRFNLRPCLSVYIERGKISTMLEILEPPSLGFGSNAPTKTKFLLDLSLEIVAVLMTATYSLSC
jgi:hypothetical protein